MRSLPFKKCQIRLQLYIKYTLNILFNGYFDILIWNFDSI